MKEEAGSRRSVGSSAFIPRRTVFAVWRNAALGTALILLGIIAAIISVLARRSNEFGLATVASVLSLVLAGLIVILIVPPLARSARFEVARLDLPIAITTG